MASDISWCPCTDHLQGSRWGNHIRIHEHYSNTTRSKAYPPDLIKNTLPRLFRDGTVRCLLCSETASSAQSITQKIEWPTNGYRLVDSKGTTPCLVLSCSMSRSEHSSAADRALKASLARLQQNNNNYLKNPSSGNDTALVSSMESHTNALLTAGQRQQAQEMKVNNKEFKTASSRKKCLIAEKLSKTLVSSFRCRFDNTRGYV